VDATAFNAQSDLADHLENRISGRRDELKIIAEGEANADPA
jgi:hypothetical protein